MCPCHRPGRRGNAARGISNKRDLLEDFTMPRNRITYNWNGTEIPLHEWADDAFGVFDYQTRNYRHTFQFSLEPTGNKVRIYILSCPPYGSRATDGHSTHRYFDQTRGQHYICVRDDLQPETVPEALSWMIYWAEETGAYIETGRAFS
jgi:hypothetical protein